jgi:hypothetical protein
MDVHRLENSRWLSAQTHVVRTPAQGGQVAVSLRRRVLPGFEWTLLDVGILQYASVNYALKENDGESSSSSTDFRSAAQQR